MTGTISGGRGAAQADGESALRYAGWRVVFACYVAAVFCWGFALYGHGVYLAELNRLHGWPTSLIASATTGFYLLTAALVVFISDAITKLGPKRIMLIGGTCFAVAVALIAVITELWQLYVAYLIMSVGAATMHVGSISNVVGLWFDRRRALAISLALNGASSGGILITPALVLAIAHFGFANAMLGSAVLFVVVLLPIIAIWIDRPAANDTANKAHQSAAISAPAMTRREALRDLAFWSVAAPIAMALTAQVGFLVHQIAFLEPLLGRAHVGWSVAILTVAAITGRVVRGNLGPAYGRYGLTIRTRRFDYVLGHARRLLVHPGDRVRPGQVVARSGKLAAPDGCHLHFEKRDVGGDLATASRPRALLALTPNKEG
jgi:MFS family permease